MATPATTFYRQSIANRLDREPYRVSDFESFGIIRPEEDPGIVEGTFSPRVTNEQIVQLDKDAMSDREGFEQNYHLPKGVFSPEDQEFDSGKENLVINVTEDYEYWLKNTLEGLDNFFRLDVSEVREIKDRFNIFVAWSTSIEDTLKTLKIVRDKIGDFANTSMLFLNDMNINSGTGPNYNFLDCDMNPIGGTNITALAMEAFNTIRQQYTKTLVQTSSRGSSGTKTNVKTTDWLHYDEDKLTQAVSDLSEDLNQSHDITIGKIGKAVEISKNNLNGIHIAIRGFLQSLTA